MRAALLCAPLVVWAGCGDNINITAAPPKPVPSCLPDCPASRGYDALAYHLHGDWDWATNTLTGSELVTLDTTQSGPIVQLDAAVAVSRVHHDQLDLKFKFDSAARTLAVDVTPLADPSAAAFTVEYTAKVGGTSDQQSGVALIVSTSSSDDPVQSRVVYTDSEPNRALLWLVTKLDPSDRALWSIDLAIPADEDMVSNGTRMPDAASNGKKVVSYALDKPIPPYLMAFAAGELEHTDRAAQGGLVPLGVWYRRGLAIDPQLTLDQVADAMTTFDSLIMPYPWDTYSVVLLPYSGGMENATITFNDETSGQATGDFVLNAHELSHHWFGDYVTMSTYDDVWFKEGMATVLESEAQRATRDRAQHGRLWGIDNAFSPTDAVVDTSLHGLEKYTSGPYERAAWVISQIRETVGEPAFWAALRSVLAAHALGSVTGEQFIRSFGLPEATVQTLLAALPAKSTPSLAVATTAVGSATQVTLTLADPMTTMIVPIELSVIDGTGTATPTSVVAGTPATIMVPSDGYLALDEHDVHPPWYVDFGMAFSRYDALGASFAPAASAPQAARTAFATRSAVQQERAGELRALTIATPADLPAYLESLDSDDARNDAVIAACGRAATDATWLAAVEPALETPYRAELNFGFQACPSSYTIAVLEPELTAAVAMGTPAADARIEYLLSFDYGADTAPLFAMVATSADSLFLRELANYALNKNAIASHVAATRARSHLRTHARAR